MGFYSFARRRNFNHIINQVLLDTFSETVQPSLGLAVQISKKVVQYFAQVTVKDGSLQLFWTASKIILLIRAVIKRTMSRCFVTPRRQLWKVRLARTIRSNSSTSSSKFLHHAQLPARGCTFVFTLESTWFQHGIRGTLCQLVVVEPFR
jgi:hypothetical protein